MFRIAENSNGMQAVLLLSCLSDVNVKKKKQRSLLSPLIFVVAMFINVFRLFLSLFQFLQDTLDTLFAVLDESPQRYGLKVFDCLVRRTFTATPSHISAECFTIWILMTNLFSSFSHAVLPNTNASQIYLIAWDRGRGLCYNRLSFESYLSSLLGFMIHCTLFLELQAEPLRG